MGEVANRAREHLNPQSRPLNHTLENHTLVNHTPVNRTPENRILVNHTLVNHTLVNLILLNLTILRSPNGKSTLSRTLRILSNMTPGAKTVEPVFLITIMHPLITTTRTSLISKQTSTIIST